MADILVIGAGMAGIATALSLQARGHTVRVVDRRGPGEETSHGNAGVIQAEARAPYAMPRDLGTLVRYALGRSNDLRLDPLALPGAARALMAYYRHSAPSRHQAATRTYSALIARATRDHGKLSAEAGAEQLIRRTGLGEIIDRPADFETRARTAERLASEYGLTLRVVDGAALAAEEPALRPTSAGAVLWDDSWSSPDPAALVQSYAALFIRRGGELLRSEVRTISESEQGWRLSTEKGPLKAEHLVVALGPWSPAMLRQLGYRIPMVMKRGYHGHFAMEDQLGRPYLLADHGVVLSSMTRGLRITTGAHLARAGAKHDFRQLEHGTDAARIILDIGDAVPDSLWQGTRPCMPRMLPMVGQAPRHARLWFNFGHGHQGFTLGPTTGEILADILDGRRDALTAALAP
ncbi:NAD(P)/FAD-dependent oxidoreductase [Notoacmeibacter ruber]|uniref:FAD-binding oxidoreductase n=1 Tax=Notoacmeibacter ruber TaxID=2670375 RepID=A0A3L7JAB7_9HYPH|nr:FAD-binding oxidoreductase [Notoacmeibacter ruber]RLQ87364.1 FAD-binding oxidoreductase [Notoacmeibacter ruber]